MDAPDPTYTMQERLEDLLSHCLRLAWKYGPHTTTCRSALQVAAFAADGLEHHPLSGREAPGELAQIAETLRDIIRADPDQAGCAIGALRVLNSAIREVGNPRGWRPTDSQFARAALALGVEPSEVHDTAFTEGGAFYARVVGGNFVEVPRDEVNPAEEREDA